MITNAFIEKAEKQFNIFICKRCDCQLCEHYSYYGPGADSGHRCDGKPVNHNIYTEQCPTPNKKNIVYQIKLDYYD